MGTLHGEDLEAGGVEPRDPLAEIEPVRLQGGAGVAGQESGDGLLHPLEDGVDVDHDELADDFTGIGGHEVLLGQMEDQTTTHADQSPRERSGRGSSSADSPLGQGRRHELPRSTGELDP